MKDYEINDQYIQDVLYQFGDYQMDKLQENIERLKLIDEGVLLDGISFKVYESGANFLVFEFPLYGRFIEIQYHKKRIQSQKDKQNPLVKEKWKREKERLKYRAKNTQWYTKQLYGSFNWLIGKLMYGLSDQVRNKIINSLQNNS